MCPSDMQFKQTFICEVLRELFTNFFATFLFAKFFTYVKVRVRMLNQWFEQTQTTYTILFRSLFFLMIPVICLLVCLKIIT